MVATRAMTTTREDMEIMQWKATTLFQSGLLPQHIKNANQVMAIDMMAQELNIPTWQAINGINVIQGKPTVSPQLMLALIERSGKLEDIEVDSNIERCIVTMKRRGRSPHTEIFSMKDAQAMQLAGKDNYKKQPAVMMKWRAISACARVVFPDVLMGMYTTEEIAPDAVQVSPEGDYEVVEVVPTNITPINSFPSKSPRLPVQEPPQIIVTDGTSAIATQPEIKQPEATSPNGTQPTHDTPATGQPTPAQPTPSENGVAHWQYDYQSLMAVTELKTLYPKSEHRSNVLGLLERNKAFEKLPNLGAAAKRVQRFHKLTRELKSSDEDAINVILTEPEI